MPREGREVESASQPTSEEQVTTEVVGGQEEPQTHPAVTEALEAAAESGELGENAIAPLEVQEAEVQSASESYNLETPGAGAVDATVEEDLEARRELAAASHREVENEELWSLAIDPDTLNSIRKDELVQVVVGERTEDTPNDYGIESTEQERIVKDLAESGQLFQKGGPLVNWTGNTDDLSDGVDGLFLAERSKQTGEKLF